MFEDIFCALSGIGPEESEVLDGVPVNWLRVTVEKQVINPEWAAIQLVKKGLIESALAQMPEDQRSVQRMGMEIQVNANFHSYESDIEQFLTIEEEVYVSPPEQNKQIVDMWDTITEMLGLEEDFSGQMTENELQSTVDAEEGETSASE